MLIYDLCVYWPSYDAMMHLQSSLMHCSGDKMSHLLGWVSLILWGTRLVSAVTTRVTCGAEVEGKDNNITPADPGEVSGGGRSQHWSLTTCATTHWLLLVTGDMDLVKHTQLFQSLAIVTSSPTNSWRLVRFEIIFEWSKFEVNLRDYFIFDETVF